MNALKGYEIQPFDYFIYGFRHQFSRNYPGHSLAVIWHLAPWCWQFLQRDRCQLSRAFA